MSYSYLKQEYNKVLYYNSLTPEEKKQFVKQRGALSNAFKLIGWLMVIIPILCLISICSVLIKKIFR